MKSIKMALIFGVLVWLIPFVTACLIYPIHSSSRPLFESIMAVVVTFSVVAFASLYFKKVGADFLKEGVRLGIIWFFISLIIDLLMFMPPSSMQMSPFDYVADIGLTYLIIPIVTIGFGCLVEKKQSMKGV